MTLAQKRQASCMVSELLASKGGSRAAEAPTTSSNATTLTLADYAKLAQGLLLNNGPLAGQRKQFLESDLGRDFLENVKKGKQPPLPPPTKWATRIIRAIGRSLAARI